MKEIWKRIENFPDYEISNYGRVKSYKRKTSIILKPSTSEGYKYVSLQKNGKGYPYRIHILVLENFICKRPKGKQAHFKDFNKLNNKVNNLEWITRKELLLKIVKTGKKTLPKEKLIENFKNGIFNNSNLYRDVRYKYKLIKKGNRKETARDKKIIDIVKQTKNYDFKKSAKKLNISRERVRQVITINGYILVKYLIIDNEICAEKIVKGRGKCRMRNKKTRVKSMHKRQLENIVKNLNRIINAIREYIPEANIFFHSEGNLSLNIHSSEKIPDSHERDLYSDSLIFEVGIIKHSDCGGY